MKIKLTKYQDEFLFSLKRFPALIAGVGTGKTFMLLLKAMRWAEMFPGAPCLIIRKEFTDLRDSTLKDFSRYFNKEVDSHKEYHLPNKSYIMFRHGGELNVLKNMNLSFVGIEQAEEFENDEQFQMLRDRLRHDAAFERKQNKNKTWSPALTEDGKKKYIHQMCIIANANGHDWVWRNWVNQPPSEDYHCVLANTFDNKENLPLSFIEDLKRKEIEAPNYYKQYVLNSFDVTSGDRVFTPELIKHARERFGKVGYSSSVRGVSFDVAGEGKDDNVIMAGSGGDITKTFVKTLVTPNEGAYKCVEMCKECEGYFIIVDCDGLGGRDFQHFESLSEDYLQGITPMRFHGSSKSTVERELVLPNGTKERKKVYANLRTEAAFVARDRISRGVATLPDDIQLIEDLEADEYIENERGEIELIKKDDIKVKLGRSPGKGDAWKMLQWAFDQNIKDNRKKLDIYAMQADNIIRGGNFGRKQVYQRIDY